LISLGFDKLGELWDDLNIGGQPAALNTTKEGYTMRKYIAQGNAVTKVMPDRSRSIIALAVDLATAKLVANTMEIATTMEDAYIRRQAETDLRNEANYKPKT